MSQMNISKPSSMPTTKSSQGGGGLTSNQLLGASSAIGGAFQIGEAVINYSMLRAESMFADVQADQIELQAKQQANLLRENFNQAIGNELLSATRRGVDVRSAGLRASTELSAKNLGEDISTLKSNAESEAGRLRAQSKINKRVAKAGLVSGILGGVNSIAVGGMSGL